MASWGAMIGLGQGLQNFGGILLDYNKSKMREQLEIEREQRQVQRELDKEQRALERELTTPAEWRPVQDESGNTYLQAFNSHGKAIQGESRPMSKYEADAFARQQRMGELELAGKEQTVANLGLEGELKGFQVRDYAGDRDLRRRQAEASIEASLASSRSRAAGAGVTATQADTEALVASRYSTLIKEAKEKFDISEVAIQRLLKRTVENEADRGLPFGSTFADALRRLLNNKDAKLETMLSSED